MNKSARNFIWFIRCFRKK